MSNSPHLNPAAMPDILKMAQQIAQNMPSSDTEGKDIDMSGMVKYVTESVTQMMGNNDVDLSGVTNTLVQTFENMQQEGTLPPIPNSKVDLGIPTQKKQIQPQRKLKDPQEIKSRENHFEEIDDDSDADEFHPRTKDLHFNLNVNLEDFYNGKVKKLQIKRKRIKKDTKGKLSVVEEKKKIAINIEKGMRDEQVIRFNKEADELPNHETGDIVITLCENPHSYFEREGDNLFIVKKVSLYESLAITRGENIELDIKHLDGRVLKIDTGDKPLHCNEGMRKITGEGIPFYKKEGSGDLFIRFNLDIPESVNSDQIAILKQLFPPLNTSIKSEPSKTSQCKLEDVTEKDWEALDYDYSTDDGSYDSDYSSDESEEIDGRAKQKEQQIERMRKKLKIKQQQK